MAGRGGENTFLLKLLLKKKVYKFIYMITNMYTSKHKCIQMYTDMCTSKQ